MDSETRNLERSVRSSLHAKVKEYKSDLKSLKSEVKRVASARSSKAREELLESGMGDTLAKVKLISYLIICIFI
jgi:vesicle transport through interaction with t-SNAREs 1